MIVSGSTFWPDGVGRWRGSRDTGIEDNREGLNRNLEKRDLAVCESWGCSNVDRVRAAESLSGGGRVWE